MITVREALTLGRLTEAELLVGSMGLDRKIEGVTIMDIPDIADWLTGGELVIAGVLFEQCFSRVLVDKLIQKQIAGIVTKKKFINSIPTELFEYCEQKGFPVIIAPADCNWGQIMNPITSYMVRKPYIIIEESLKFHDVMMCATIDGVSLSEMCTRMYDSTGMSFAVFDNDLHIIGFSGDFDWKSYTRNITSGNIQYEGISSKAFDESEVYFYSYSSMLLRSISRKLLMYPVTLNHIKYGYVAISVKESLDQLRQIDIVKIQQMGLFVALHSTKLNEISNATRRFNGLLMDQLLSESSLTQHQVETLLAPMGKKLHRSYYAVQLIHDELNTITSFVQRNNRIGLFHSMVEEKLEQSNHILIFEKSDSQIVLIPHPTPNLDELLYEIRSMFLEATGMSKLYMGISDPVPLTEIKTAFIQSEHAANYLRSTKSKKQYFYYHDLGVLKYFMDNKGGLNENFLKSCYNRYVTPLIEHDRQYNTQLLKTLECYINNNCSKTETEKQLFIHKNTLRARLATIGKILDCNVDAAEDMFNIQMALKLKFFFENPS